MAGRDIQLICQEDGPLLRKVLKGRFSKRCIGTSLTLRTGFAAYTTTSAATIFNLNLNEINFRFNNRLQRGMPALHVLTTMAMSSKTSYLQLMVAQPVNPSTED
jgi:hypothetical protein